ncbi:hypothetical protein E3N88_36243 [Mikania micrantha]|uniref:Calmodulin-binding domain-containing protein n=1 Tax=Mikania micrantha TaxID=192012 RepID=A0A5N6M5Z2_9ASTR|nr:hypothetical protein E3N88_36243 [Mikania micrantha]
MAIGSALIRGVRRTWKNNKPQMESPSSDSSKTNSSLRKGDNDSKATSFSSSVLGSTSSVTSATDRYGSGVEGGNHQKKKLDSRKPTAFGSISRRTRSQLSSLPDDGPATTHHLFPKPTVHKFMRSGSLRSLKILRKKNTTSSESKSLTIKDSHPKKATFSSILKDSKFTEQVTVKKSDQVLSVAKLCPNEHCSLHGHHHHEPQLKRFTYLKRRSSKDQKNITSQTQAADRWSVKKKQVKATKHISKESEKKKEEDFSIEFYAKTRPESSFDPNFDRDGVHLADIMFCVNGDDQNEDLNLHMDNQDYLIFNIDGENGSLDGSTDVEDKKPGFNNDNQMSMWQLIHRHMVLEAIDKILLPEEDPLEKNQTEDQSEPNQGDNYKPNGWNHLKKVTLMKRFTTELENNLAPHKRGHVPREPEPELIPVPTMVSLRSLSIQKQKNSYKWMLDYALQQVVAELAPSQKRKVALLVKSFETITPKLEKEAAI